MKKIHTILICLIVISIISLIILLSWRNLPKNDKVSINVVQEEITNEYAKNVQVKESKKTISPLGTYHLYNVYEGKISKTYLQKKVYEFVESIPEFYKKTENMNNQALSSYYENNKSDVLKKTGINSASEFVKFINAIPFENGQEEYVRSEFTFEEYTEDTSYVHFDYVITYSNEKDFVLRVDLCKNGSSDKPLISFNAK